MILPFPSRFLATTTAVLVGWGAELPACQICLPMPTESLADKILGAEHLALARENPEQAFTLRAIRTLRSRGELPPIDLFLDSSSRRRLASDGGLSILCGWTPVGAWQRLTIFDPVSGPVIADILANAETWQADPEARLRYFADLLDHDDPRLSDLAHLEVAGAPYRDLLRYADRLPREELLARLANFRRLEWHALYILFLSQSENPSDHERIRREIAEAADYRLATQTAAWATAFIEIDGPEAVAQLGDWYGNPKRRPEEWKAVLAALAVQGREADRALQDPIVGLMGRLLAADPSLAQDIATTLTEWKRPELVGPITELLKDSPEYFDPTATLILRRYLRETAAPPNTKGESENGRFLLPLLGMAALVLLVLVLASGRLRAEAPADDNSHHKETSVS